MGSGGNVDNIEGAESSTCNSDYIILGKWRFITNSTVISILLF